MFHRHYDRRHRPGNVWVGMGVFAVVVVFMAINEFRYLVWGHSATATMTRKFHEKHEQETHQNGHRRRQTVYNTVIEFTYTEADGTVRTGRSSSRTSMTDIGEAERMINSPGSSATGAAQNPAGSAGLGTVTVRYLAGVDGSARLESVASPFWLYGVVLVLLIGAGILSLDYFDVFGLHRR